jgi:hypothetical protein
MSNEVLTNEVLTNEVHEVQANKVQDESADQVESKSWFARYEQFLYGTIVGGAAVILSLSVRSLIRSK